MYNISFPQIISDHNMYNDNHIVILVSFPKL